MLYEGRTLLQDRLRGLFWLSLAGQGGHMRAQSLYRKLSDTLDATMTKRIAEMEEAWRGRAAPPPPISIDDVPALDGLLPR